jgi:nitrogen regulatory protein P-II 1
MIEAIVREEMLDAVMEALNKEDINGATVFQVMGFGQQKGFTEYVRSLEIEVTLIPKILFKIAVSTEELEKKVVAAIREVAGTGAMGDGKIFSYELKDVVRIRTGETGTAAL